MLQDIWNRLVAKFGPDRVADALAEFIPSLLTAAIILVGFIVLWKLLDHTFEAFRGRTTLDETLGLFAKTSIKYIVLAIGLLMALGEVGIDVTAIVASLGIAGLTIGFAARDTLSNLISGIFIFWDRPFVVGDLIEMNEFYGRVEDITLRSTRVVTVDGRMLAIPNTTIINSVVASYTNFPHVRIGVEVTFGVDEDLEHAREVFLNAVEQDKQFMGEPAPAMVVKALNDYNVEVEFRVWVKDEKSHVAERFRFREMLYARFQSEGLDMPYETIQLMPLQAKVAMEQRAAS